MKHHQNSFHLAGIIPIACQPLDFDMPWHDCMMPLSKGYLLIERAVLECAMVGCETIWIVCPITIQPLLKSVLGDHIEDPVMFNRTWDDKPRTKKKFIPIYYVPVHPKDQDTRGSLIWSLIYGAQQADHVCRTMSKWVAPNRFYVAHPYGIYPFEGLREFRKEISMPRRFIVSTGDFDFRHGYYTGFTFDYSDLKEFRKKFFQKESRLWDGSSELKDGKYATKRLPIEKRYTGRYLTLDEVLGETDIKDSLIVEVEWYYWGDTWEGLRDFYASHKDLEKPAELFKQSESNKIGRDED